MIWWPRLIYFGNLVEIVMSRQPMLEARLVSSKGHAKDAADLQSAEPWPLGRLSKIGSFRLHAVRRERSNSIGEDVARVDWACHMGGRVGDLALQED
jgi:hypothetical protein